MSGLGVDWAPAWQRHELERLRGRSNDALTQLDRDGAMRACVVRFLRHVLDAVSDKHGVIWAGALELAERMGLTERRVRQLIAAARLDGWLQRIHVGGGRHRTSRYALKFGEWRDERNDAHAQAHFAERARAGNAVAEAWQTQLFAEHLYLGKNCCRQFAPRELKNPEIHWMQT